MIHSDMALRPLISAARAAGAFRESRERSIFRFLPFPMQNRPALLPEPLQSHQFLVAFAALGKMRPLV